jgi:stringent starvation protein B
MSANTPTQNDMTDNRPHLINMFNAWFSENGLRTFLLVDTGMINSSSPLSGVSKDNTIVLNIGMNACPDFKCHADSITMTLRFNGILNHLSFPAKACRAIYSPENSMGTPLYGYEEDEETMAVSPKPVLSEASKISDARQRDHDASDNVDVSDKKAPKLHIVH